MGFLVLYELLQLRVSQGIELLRLMVSNVHAHASNTDFRLTPFILH